MAVGFKSYEDSSSNRLIADLTVATSQNIGYVDTNKVNGSITVAEAPNGRTFFHFVVALEPNATADGLRPGILITDNGDTRTITWTYSYTPGFGRFSLNCRIHYGYF